LRDRNGSSSTMEIALLNDQSKPFRFLRGAEIGRAVIAFCRPDIWPNKQILSMERNQQNNLFIFMKSQTGRGTRGWRMENDVPVSKITNHGSNHEMLLHFGGENKCWELMGNNCRKMESMGSV
jgi:hypothetical protein